MLIAILLWWYSFYMSKLSSYRKLKKMSQSDLSKVSGVSIRTIQAYEQGCKDISKASNYILLKLSSALCIDAKQLIESKKNKVIPKIGKTAIIGMGFVGNAVMNYLDSIGVNVTTYDKKDRCRISYDKIDSVIICVSTDYSDFYNSLDISDVEQSITEILKDNKNIDIYIKSTMPIGSCMQLVNKFNYERIFYVPEFLKEKTALEDIKNPSRVIIGTNNKGLYGINKYLSLYSSDVSFLVTGLVEAESIKLYSNAYLAHRLAFFNEVDTFTSINNIDTDEVIKGISLDPRIGNYYNSPSYGYGGYCLPKDNKALSNITGSAFIKSAEISNEERKKHIVNLILERVKDIEKPVIGIYKVITRNSPIFEIINLLENTNCEIALLKSEENIEISRNCLIFYSKTDFISRCDLILSEDCVGLKSEKILSFVK